MTVLDKLIKYYKKNKENDNIYLTRVSSENEDCYRVIKSIEEKGLNLDIKNMGDFVRLLIAAKSITLPYIKNVYQEFISLQKINEYIEQRIMRSELFSEIQNFEPLYKHNDTPLEEDSKSISELYKSLNLQDIIKLNNQINETLLKYGNITIENLEILCNKDFLDKYQKQILSLVNMAKRQHGLMNDSKKYDNKNEKMSIFDEIQNPLNNNETFKKMLDIYINGRVDSGSRIIENKDDFYKRVTDYGCEHKKNQDEYRDGFYKYIKIPNLEKLYRNFREINSESSKFKIIFNSFKSYSDIEKVYYEQGLAEIESIFDNIALYPSLKQENLQNLQQLNLTEKQIENRKILIEFRRKLINSFWGGDGVMGFHVNPQILHEHDSKEKKVKGEMKFYINAGVNTYRFASLFQEKCEKLHLNYYFKVVNADDEGEYKRNDKMCIYTEIKDANTFLSILKELKIQNPDIKFEDPPFLSGTIDEFIGVGMEPKGYSYNQQMSEICFNSIIKVFGEIPREKIFETIQIYPEMLTKLRQEIISTAKNIGLSEDKICIDNDVAQKLKHTNKETERE